MGLLLGAMEKKPEETESKSSEANNQTEGTDRNDTENPFESMPQPAIKASEMAIKDLISMRL